MLDECYPQQPTATPITISTHLSSCFSSSKVWLLNNIQQVVFFLLMSWDINNMRQHPIQSVN